MDSSKFELTANLAHGCRRVPPKIDAIRAAKLYVRSPPWISWKSAGWSGLLLLRVHLIDHRGVFAQRLETDLRAA